MRHEASHRLTPQREREREVVEGTREKMTEQTGIVWNENTPRIKRAEETVTGAIGSGLGVKRLRCGVNQYTQLAGINQPSSDGQASH